MPEHLKSQPRGLNQGLSLHLKETIEDHLEMELSEQLNLLLRLGSQGEVGATEPRGHWRKKKKCLASNQEVSQCLGPEYSYLRRKGLGPCN